MLRVVYVCLHGLIHGMLTCSTYFYMCCVRASVVQYVFLYWKIWPVGRPRQPVAGEKVVCARIYCIRRFCYRIMENMVSWGPRQPVAIYIICTSYSKVHGFDGEKLSCGFGCEWVV